MSIRLPRCECCGRAFRPDRYNALTQKYCTRDPCVQERKRKRQRRWYADRRARDPAFAEAERVRCAEANRRRRSAARETARVEAAPEPEEAAAGDVPVSTRDVVTGLLSQITDCTDPTAIRASLLEYAARGRRVALPLSIRPRSP